VTTATSAYQLVRTVGVSILQDDAPSFIWGVGTPNGDLVPFIDCQKGSLYFQADATDDNTHIYQKVDEGGDDADWVKVIVGSTNAYTVTNLNTDRTFDADSTSTAELADVLGTLITDLQNSGLLA